MTHDEIIDECLGHAAGLFDRLRLTRMCRMAVADSNEVALTNNVRLVTALRAQVKQRDEQIVKLLQMVSSQPSPAILDDRVFLREATIKALGVIRSLGCGEDLSELHYAMASATMAREALAAIKRTEASK